MTVLQAAPVPPMGPVLSEGMAQAEALLFGRRTWHAMASAWPGRAGDPYADQMNAIPKYVVSRTLTAEEASSRWHNTTLLAREGAVGAIRQLRDRPGDGGILVWGSASLARQLVENAWATIRRPDSSKWSTTWTPGVRVRRHSIGAPSRYCTSVSSNTSGKDGTVAGKKASDLRQVGARYSLLPMTRPGSAPVRTPPIWTPTPSTNVAR
jgi:hypothetical protein